MTRRDFTRGEILQIRRAHRWGNSLKELSEAFSVSKTAIRNIVKFRTYRRVRDDSPESAPGPLPTPPEQRPTAPATVPPGGTLRIHSGGRPTVKNSRPGPPRGGR